MTARELIGKLATFPPDAPVIYRLCSDWAELGADDVTLADQENKNVVFRQNRYCDRYEERMFPPGEVPVYATAVCFPGN